MFKYFKLSILVISLLLSYNAWGQRVSSEKKKIRITTGKIEINVIYPKTRGFKPTDKSGYPLIDSKKTEVIVDVKGGLDPKKVRINDGEATLYADSHYYKNVKLSTGENIITIVAEDSRGNKATKSIKVICTYQYDIEVNNAKYYALLIGVNDYNDKDIEDLNRPIEDIQRLKEILEKKYAFSKENIIVLENPKRGELIIGFEQISDSLKKEDNLLIFYAGHGMWDDEKEIGYWLPADAEALNTDNWFRNSTAKEYISSMKCKHALLISDACFSGSIFKTRSITESGLSAYNKLYKLQSRKGMTSGTLNKVPDKSIFTEYLLKRLEHNEEKYLPAAKLFNSLRDAVLNNSPNVPQYGVIQGVGDEGGEFIFIRK